MNTNLIVSELLHENYQTECDTVGPTNLEDIIGSEVEFVPADYGSNMDLGTAVQTLIVASAFIKTIIDIYVALKKELKRDPEEVELVLKITTKKDLVEKIDKNTQDKLVKAIAKKLKVKG
jgi:hypothetical protein